MDQSDFIGRSVSILTYKVSAKETNLCKRLKKEKNSICKEIGKVYDTQVSHLVFFKTLTFMCEAGIFCHYANIIEILNLVFGHVEKMD